MNIRINNISGKAFGLGAALAYGTSSVLIKQGVAEMTTPLVGAALALLSGTIVLTVVELRSRTPDLLQKRRPILFLSLAGIFAALGIMSSFFALSIAPVVVVSPIQSTIPLFALVGSYLFLRQREKITLRIVVGTVFVVGGVALVAVGRIA